jgi:hypothetical protein
MLPAVRPRRLWLSCAAAFALGAVPAGAAPVNGVQIAKVGQGNVVSDVVNAKALGAKIIRVEIRWETLEPDAAGVQDAAIVQQADALVAKARAVGVKLLLTVDGTPCWASAAPDAVRGSCTTPEQRQAAAAYPPADPQTYAAVARFLAGRYAGALAAFEVWNEPDHADEYYFAGPDKPARYAALLKAAYPAVKGVAPNVAVLAGSLVGSNGTFLRALYSAGIKGYYDGLSVHYYDLVLASLRSIRDVQRKAGDTKPLWLAEYGWTSCRPAVTQGGHACVTRTAQGADITDIVRALAHTSYVKSAVIYNLQDTSQYSFGLLGQDGARKPAFAVVRRAFTTSGPLRPVSLKLSRTAAGVVASGRGPVGDAFELNAYDHGALRYHAVFSLDRDGRFRLRLPSVVRRGMDVSVTQFWHGQYARHRVR